VITYRHYDKAAGFGSNGTLRSLTFKSECRQTDRQCHLSLY